MELEMYSYMTEDAGNIMDMLMEWGNEADSSFEDIFLEFFDEEGYLYEAGAIKKAAAKSVGAIKQVLKTAATLASYLGTGLFSRLEKLIGKGIDSSLRLKTRGAFMGKQINAAMQKVRAGLEKFKSMAPYQKATIPVASILSWVPPFTPIPGADAMLISASSVGDFLLDFKRRYMGQDYSAIKNFDLWIQANMDKLSETDIYACDKLMQRVSNVIMGVSAEIKKYTLGLNQLLLKGVSAGAKAGESVTQDGSKANKTFKKIKDTADAVGKTAKETQEHRRQLMQKRKEVNNELSKDSDQLASHRYERKVKKNEKKLIKKGTKAQQKAKDGGGYKALNKREYQNLQMFRRRYGQ